MFGFLRQRILCHGTKFNVPDRHQFWNDLYESANARFYLIGKTNKSWITKNSEQPEAFASSILRIVHGGGKVKILSDDAQTVVDATNAFVDELILPELQRLPEHLQTQQIERLKKHFIYAVSGSSHYRAVVSDDRLVFIPSLNSTQFRDDALVFELSKTSAPFEFHTYMSDIDRLFDEESKHIPIDWSSRLAAIDKQTSPGTAK